MHHPPAFRPAQTDTKAVVSLVLGVMSLGCLGPVLGLPAIVLGAVARRDIDQSSGLLTGRGVAAGGIVSGLFGTGMGVVVALWILGAVFQPGTPETDARNAASSMTATTAAATAASPPAPANVAVPSAAHAYADVEEARPLRDPREAPSSDKSLARHPRPRR